MAVKMSLRKITSITSKLEDPKYPMLGPNIKSLRALGLWQTNKNIWHSYYCFMLFWMTLLFITELIEVYETLKIDFTEPLYDLSIALLNVVVIVKGALFIFRQSYWKELLTQISVEEISQNKSQEPVTINIMKGYIRHGRVLTYSYWVLCILTSITVNSTPLLKYISNPTFRLNLRNGVEPPPLVLGSWFPFDKTKMPGYLTAVMFQAVMIFFGASTVGVYDSTALSIMAFMKGQLSILKAKSKRIFGNSTGESLSRQIVLARIKECHRHHKYLIKQFELFNSLLSPALFLYVLVCSIGICCSVIQLVSENATTPQKLWVLEYTIALTTQLFLYCWHSNEITSECYNLDGGVYGSCWWKADVPVRKQLLLLAGKFSQPMILYAGPFTALSMATFLNIIKGAYSFYTLFSTMQEN